MLTRLSRKPFVFLLGLIACLFVADRAIAFVAQRILLSSDHRIAKVYAGGRHDDILILGNSVANAMVLPQVLGSAVDHSAFTVAVHGLDAVAQQALVQDYLERNAAPKIALLELRTVSVSYIRAKEFLLFSIGNTHMGELNNGLSRTTLPWDDIFHTYRLNSPLLPNTLQRIIHRKDQQDGATDGRMNAAMVAEFEKTAADRFIFQRQKDSFHDSLDALTKAGSRPFVVVAPLHPAARIQAREMLADVVPQLPRGVPVCDFSALLDDDRFYEDPAHLNNTGRMAFTPYLAALITQNWGAVTEASSKATAHPSDEILATVARLCTTNAASAPSEISGAP